MEDVTGLQGSRMAHDLPCNGKVRQLLTMRLQAQELQPDGCPTGPEGPGSHGR